jgi:sugar lactone lactonase YvrE
MLRSCRYNLLTQISILLSWALFFLIFLPLHSNAQIITTIAGTGTGGYNGDGILATAAQFNGVQGLAIDSAGNIYAADIAGNRIRKITVSTGLISTVAGTGTQGYNGDGILATAAQIYNPSALAFDGNGDLYFTDRSNHRIRKITTSTGIISTVAGTGTAGYNGDGIAATTAQLNNPNEVAFDTSGNLYIADWINHRVRKVNYSTGIITTIAGTGTAGFNGDGIAATAAQINGPCGIIFDNAGNIYIGEFGGGRVRKITISSGLISTIAGTGTNGYNGDGIAATSAQLNFSAYMRFDGAENMYIGDAGNSRVRKITKTTGIISTVAGTGTFGYNGDGIAATSAQLYNPFLICFDDTKCNMYIADYTNNRIRKITGGFTGCNVAAGNLASCQVLPAISINTSNKKSWVPVFDSVGNIAALINANGNNLGAVSTSLYTKTGSCREDPSYRLYLNRNITITPQNQPASGNVSVRLYILKAELDTLKTAINSLSQPSGVASINEVDVFKNNNSCVTTGGITALPLTATNGVYNSDYYLQVNISSFSSFYFANKALSAILPVKLKSFMGKHIGMANELKWEADCFDHVVFNVERSADGIHFNTIEKINAGKMDCNKPFYFTDKNILPGNNFYRLQIIETNGAINYSSVVLLNNIRPINIRLMNNPLVKKALDVELFSETTSQVELICTDITGRMIMHKKEAVLTGNNQFSLDVVNISKGIYWLYAVDKTGKSNIIKFVK